MTKEHCQHHTPHRSDKLVNDLTVRLNKIEGQIRGIKGMIEKNIYCDDILTQVSSVQSALSSFNKMLLENHIRTCIVERVKQDDAEVVDELVKTLARALRS